MIFKLTCCPYAKFLVSEIPRNLLKIVNVFVDCMDTVDIILMSYSMATNVFLIFILSQGALRLK